ncbi:hypothetical protein V6N13_098164 [Hibiscus sabdariffa]
MVDSISCHYKTFYEEAITCFAAEADSSFVSDELSMITVSYKFDVEGSFNLHQTRTAQQKWHNVLLNKNINHHFPIDGRLVESLLEKDGSGDILAETRGQG